MSDRATFVGGDFFQSVPSGDVPLLANVLHDRDDARGAGVSRVVAAADLVVQQIVEAFSDISVVTAVAPA